MRILCIINPLDYIQEIKVIEDNSVVETYEVSLKDLPDIVLDKCVELHLKEIGIKLFSANLEFASGIISMINEKNKMYLINDLKVEVLK